MTTHREQKHWLFLSDAHFTGREPGETDAFLGFLEGEKDHVGHLVILGDLFEFLFGFRRSSHGTNMTSKDAFFPFPEYLPVLKQLQHLYRQGTRVTYGEGNHDFALGSFFADHFGMNVTVHATGWEERLGEKRAYIAHGDLVNPKEWRYRIFRRLVKNPITLKLIHWVGPPVTRRVAERFSTLSHQAYHQGDVRKTARAFQAFARKKFSQGYDMVILGHSHFPEEMEAWVDGKYCRYFNVGDWMTHRSFLRFRPPDKFDLCHYGG